MNIKTKQIPNRNQLPKESKVKSVAGSVDWESSVRARGIVAKRSGKVKNISMAI
jgi:hypothetical protein